MESSPARREEWRTRYLPLLATLIGGLFWIGDSALDAFVLGGSPFFDSITHPEPIELWMRGLLIAALIGFAFHARTMMRRYQQARDVADAATRSKSTFLASMSHEIRTPLTAILGYADELLRGNDLTAIPPGQLQAVEAIRRNGNHLLQIVNDILDLSKVEAGRLEVDRIPCSALEISNEAAAMMHAQARAKGLEIIVEYPTALPETIGADPTRLRQILVNLVGNAIKFTDRGSIRIVTRLIEQPAAASIQLEVSDTGLGMTAEQLSRVFEPFTQADPSTTRHYGGTGLGLTICRRLVEALDGTIEVESEQGSGTTFRVTVPFEPIDGATLIENPSRVMAAAASGGAEPIRELLLDCRILLAEDAADIQRLIEQILRQAGAEVEVVDNGRLAIECTLEALREGQPFDVILMDVEMPVIDGYEAIRALRRADYDRPIIALTAHATTSDRESCLSAGCDEESCLSAGCDDFATKPIDRASLIEVVARYAGPAKRESLSTL
jgi:signal transduction histidine kinase/ActR/RegA family two-component response regulator